MGSDESSYVYIISSMIAKLRTLVMQTAPSVSFHSAVFITAGLKLEWSRHLI